MNNIILFGFPGSGKSTLVEMLKDEGYDFSYIELGEYLRELTEKKTPLGKKIKEVISKGELLDDFTISQLVKKKFREIDKTKPIIFDGYPRSLSQARISDEILLNSDLELPLLVYIKVTKKEVIRRLTGRRVCVKCGENYQLDQLKGLTKCERCGGQLIQRDDDQKKAIEKRFELFSDQFKLIKKYYKFEKRFYQIDGEKEKKKRLSDLIKIIKLKK